MGKPSAPAAPDPRETAGAQTAQNIGTAIAQQQLNNVNQITPYGTLTYDQSGSYEYTDPNTGAVHNIPTYTATQQLSEGQQAIFDQNQQSSLNLATLGANQSGRLDGLLSRPMDVSGLPDRGDPAEVQGPDLGNISNGPQLQTDVGPGSRQRVEDALMERMQPGLDRDRTALEARLASQGIRIGSEAYNAAMDDFGRQTNDARLSAILGAGQEQSREVSTAIQRAGFSNQAEQQMHLNSSNAAQANNQTEIQRFNADMAQQNAMGANRNAALSEAFAVRNQPINEITALMSGAQVQNPNFVNTNPAQVANTDVAGITMASHNAAMQNYQSQMGSWNNIFGGLAGLGGAAIMASDRRVKTDIKKVGKTDDGQNLYQYRYKDGGPMQIGLMAQEVEKRNPEAVLEVNGLKLVNYDKALGAPA